MARIRTVKPEFFRHEGLQDLEIANPGKYPMMVFEALWGHCDSKGRFEWKPRTLKLDILPFLPFDMAETLELLEMAGMLHRYEDGGKEYGYIDTFEKHQRISGKEATEGEKFPAPCSETIAKQRGSSGEIPESQEGKGKEGKGKEPPKPPTAESQPSAPAESKDSPKPPDGGLAAPVKKPATALKTFLDNCKQKGERPLRDYAPLWAYTKAAGLSEDFIALAWGEFCRRFLPGGAQPEKRQKDWRCTFRKYVENNYFRLWAIDKDGVYFLTSTGKQAEKFQEGKSE